MRIEVDKNFVKFNTNNLVNKREFKATPLEFSFSKDYEGLTCKAVFSVIPKTKDEEITFYQQPIIDNKCYIPYEVMDAEGILIGVYGYSVEGDELLLRYSPEPKNLWFLEGSYYEGAEDPEEILPSQFEQYVAYLNSQITRLDQMKIETEDLSNGVKISITNSNGITTETTIYDGERGPEGPQGEPGTPGEPGAPGRDGYVQYTAGDNITIENDVISATDTTYTAGTGINITNNVISATGGSIPIYIWDGRPWNSSSPDTNADVKETWDKVLDCFFNNKPFSFYMIRNARVSNQNRRLLFNITFDYISATNILQFSCICFNTENYRYGIRGLIINGISNNKVTYVPDLTGNNIVYYGAFTPAYNNTNVTNGSALTIDNTKSFTPTGDYNPATKKYVDDNVNPTIITDSGTTYTIASLTGNKSYKLGELTSLTITSSTTFDRESVLYFTSGTTATSVSLPDSITNIGDVPTMSTSSNVNTGTCEASKSYIIAILNNIAVWKAY